MIHILSSRNWVVAVLIVGILLTIPGIADAARRGDVQRVSPERVQATPTRSVRSVAPVVAPTSQKSTQDGTACTTLHDGMVLGGTTSGVVHLCEGEHILGTKGVLVKRPITIDGGNIAEVVGPGISEKSSGLILLSNGITIRNTSFRDFYTAIEAPYKAGGTSIQDITISGNELTDNEQGVYLYNPKRAKVSDNTFETNRAITLAKSNDNFDASRNFVERNTISFLFDSIFPRGIHVSSGSSANPFMSNTIRDNTIQNYCTSDISTCISEGISSMNAGKFHVIGNKLFDMTGNAISFGGAVDVLILNNTILRLQSIKKQFVSGIVNAGLVISGTGNDPIISGNIITGTSALKATGGITITGPLAGMIGGDVIRMNHIESVDKGVSTAFSTGGQNIIVEKNNFVDNRVQISEADWTGSAIEAKGNYFSDWTDAACGSDRSVCKNPYFWQAPYGWNSDPAPVGNPYEISSL